MGLRSGRLSTETGSSGRQVLHNYDLASRETKITDQVGGSLDPSITVNRGPVVREERIYYQSGELHYLKDGSGNTLTYDYEPFKRIKSVTYPGGAKEWFAYDKNDNVTLKQNRDGKQIISTYDNLDRLQTKAPQSQPIISFGYDYSGLLLTAQSSSDAAPYSYGYDAFGRKTSETSPGVGGGTVTMTLDDMGRPRVLNSPDSPQGVVYSHNAAGYLKNITLTAPQSLAVQIVNDRAGRPREYGFAPTGSGSFRTLQTSFTVTRAGDTDLIKYRNQSAFFLTLDYSYNSDHQNTGVTATDGDYLVSGIVAETQSYTVNGLNQYTAVNANPLTYDLNGNLTSDGLWTFGYDTENRLVSATDGVTSASYSYDPFDRRRSKTVDGVVTYYRSYGDRVIAELDTAGSLLRRYIYGNDAAPLVVIDGAGNPSWVAADALGSVIALVDVAGNISEKHSYDPYGRSNSVTGFAYQFAGMRIDAETGLYLAGARYYSPKLGRFLQADPSGVAGGINLYAYSLNDPLNRTDPTGLASQHQYSHQSITAHWTSSFKPLASGFGAGFEASWSGTDNRLHDTLFGNGGYGEKSSAIAGLMSGFVVRTAGDTATWIAGDGIFRNVAGIGKIAGGKITGFTKHGINRAVGDGAKRAGTSPKAILDAVKNPSKVVNKIDTMGRPSVVYTGKDARVIVNAKGKVISTNPLSGAGTN